MTRREEIDGSEARDHLANERTFLAWVRTGLAASAFGVAILKLLAPPGGTVRVAGWGFFGLGLVIVVFGAARYFWVRRGLRKGRIRIGGKAMLAVVLAVAGLGVPISVLVLL